MGDYKDISNLEGFVQSTQDPFVLNPRIKHFFKKSRIVGSGSEPSPISHVALSEEGTLCAIVSGTKTTFYDYSTSSTSHTYSSAKDFLRSASFRSDSKLAGISDDSGTIHLFALPLKSVLRRFKAHKGACHTNAFSMDKTHLMTGGDDQVVNYWDITQQQCISTFSKHVDKVRSLCPMPGDPNIWLTSSYDTFAHLYDVRSGDEPIASVSHKAPIEHVSFASSGLSFVTCGASKVKIWDLASGMNLRHSYKPHTRTVISASYLEEEKILITASLDSSVKYFYAGSELDQFHEYKFESQITSFGVTRSGGTLVTGLSSGEWVIRHNSEGIGAIVEEPVRLVAVGVEKEYTEVVGHKTRKFKPLDRLMKEFQYQAALEMAIGMG